MTHHKKSNLVRATVWLLAKIKLYRTELFVLLFAAIFFGMNIFQYLLGTDESDNFLAGKLILSGELPYRDFFSHHMPGPHLMAAIFHFLSFGNIVIFRMLFDVFIFAWLVYNFLFLRKHLGVWPASLYLLLATAAAGISLQYQFLAEGFVALSATTALLWILLLKPRELLERKRFILLSILLFAIPFFALSYIYVALILYLILAIKLLSHKLSLLTNIAILGSPYVLAGICFMATGTLKEFLFQNLTFNANYYALFSGATNTNPLKAGLDIAVTSLQQITAVLLHPLDYPLEILLLGSFMIFPTLLYIRRERKYAILVASLILFANSRVELYGVPAIKDFSSLSHHAELYRTLAITSLSASLDLLINGSYKKNPKIQRFSVKRTWLLNGITAVSIILGAGFLYNTLQTRPLNAMRNMSSVRHSQPSVEVQIINNLTSPDDYAWIGPINFLDQSFLEAKIATSYTFFMPWHQVCNSCHDEFYQQLKEQKPVVISWKKFGGVPSYPVPSYSHDIEAYLMQNYFQLDNQDTRFANLYFLAADRTRILHLLKESGYL